jgi:hypothetical protein
MTIIDTDQIAGGVLTNAGRAAMALGAGWMGTNRDLRCRNASQVSGLSAFF